MSDFPYFPLYVSDLLGDDKVILQNLTEFGAYVRLLCLAWQQRPPCTIPADDAVIAKMLSVPLSEWLILKANVIPCWQPSNASGNGRLYNKRLKAVFDEMMESRLKRQKAGQLGGKHRSSNAQAPLKQIGCGGGSGSGTPSGGEDKMENAKSIEALALAAERCFSPEIVRASAGVLANVADIISAGIKPENFHEVFDWVKKGGKYKPQHAMSLTDPGKFGGFVQQSRKKDGEHSGVRTRKLNKYD